MRKIRVLFEVYLLYHLPQFLPLYEVLRRDGRYELFFSAGGHSDEERCRTVEVLRSESLDVIEGETEQERFDAIDNRDIDVLIVGWGRRGYIDRIAQRRPRPVVIMIYHGIGVKASYFRDNNPRVDYRAVESPYRVRQLRKHGVAARPLLCGCVKLDPLYRTTPFDRTEILLGLGLDPELPTILYAPTYYPSSIRVLAGELGRATTGWNVVVKPHNYTRFHPDYADDLAILTSVARECSHVTIVPDSWYNILPLFHAADLLISDASSVMFEYLPLDRPIVVVTKHYLYPRHRLFPFFYRRNRIDSETLSYRDFYDRVSRPGDLRKTIQENLARPDRLGPQRKRAHDELLHFSDGRAALRLKEEIERIVSSGEAHGHR